MSDDIHKTHFPAVGNFGRRKVGETKIINGTRYEWDGKKWVLPKHRGGYVSDKVTFLVGRTWD